ncbi:hypothetical protein D3C75_715940 [compost metagenome]
MPLVEGFAQGRQAATVEPVAAQFDAALVDLSEVTNLQAVLAFNTIVTTETIVSQVRHTTLA